MEHVNNRILFETSTGKCASDHSASASSYVLVLSFPEIPLPSSRFTSCSVTSSLLPKEPLTPYLTTPKGSLYSVIHFPFRFVSGVYNFEHTKRSLLTSVLLHIQRVPGSSPSSVHGYTECSSVQFFSVPQENVGIVLEI